MSKIEVIHTNQVAERTLSYLLQHPRIRKTRLGRRVSEAAINKCAQHALTELTQAIAGIVVPVTEEVTPSEEVEIYFGKPKRHTYH